MVNSEVVEKNNDECKKIDTSHLIALCEIRDDYISFREDLEKLIKSKSNKNLVEDVYRVMHGDSSIFASQFEYLIEKFKKTFRTSKYNSFIEKHKKTIEILNKYLCLMNFTILSYDTNGIRRKNLSEDYFYQYIEKNKENIETIKSIALKLRELGFYTIQFNEELDFSKYEFELDKFYDGSFKYLDNIEIIPTYTQNTIRYRTTGSSYCMYLDSHRYVNRGICENGKRIVLNSLIFDPSKLPNEITAESTIEVIRKLSDEKMKPCNDIRDSVDLSVSTADLENQFEILKKVLERIDKTKNNEEIANLLNQMKNLLVELHSFGEKFEHQVVETHRDITNETMENEKKLYLKRRYLANIDID